MKLYVYLDNDEMQMLLEMSKKAMREPKQQVRWLIRKQYAAQLQRQENSCAANDGEPELDSTPD